MLIRAMFPIHYQVEISSLRQQLDQAHHAWWTEWKSQQTDFVIENIRFDHDPNWNKRFFSIQSAHDLNHWAWKATAIVWVGFGGRI